jgi:HNH endonuclease
MQTTIEWLRAKYIDEQLSCPAIASLVGVDPKTIYNRIRAAGIPIRTTGNDPSSRKGIENFDVNHQVGRKLSEETKAKIRTARIRDGHVPYLKAGQHWLKTVPKDQHPNWKGGITPERQTFNASPEWRRAVYAVKRRDKNTCQLCDKKRRRGDAFDVHHIVSFADCVELRATISNLVYLCEPCHYWVHSPANTEKEFILPCPSSTKP